MPIAKPGQLNIQELPDQGSRTLESSYQCAQKIGEGSYGEVFIGKQNETGETVAVKKLIIDKEEEDDDEEEDDEEGFPISAVREIKHLQKLNNHDNVLKLKEVVTSPAPGFDDKQNVIDNGLYKGAVYMVMEYMDHDLSGLLDKSKKNKYLKFTVPQIKCYMKQLLTGIDYCHENGILHRDIKPANILINNDGVLKIADFGLAHHLVNGFSLPLDCQSDHSKDLELTGKVCSLWYRPLELLLGAKKYGPAVDIWSVGCIFGELLTGKVLFHGNNAYEQINQICNVCGSPDEADWPEVKELPLYKMFRGTSPVRRNFQEFYNVCDGNAVLLLERMLTLNPDERITAKEALESDYFRTPPLACDPESLPKYRSSHQFQAKNLESR